MSENAQFRLFWCMAALTLLVVALFIEVGCQTAEDRYNESVWENKLYEQKLDLQEKEAKGKADLERTNAQGILALTAHEQVALKAQGLSAKLQGALWILGISLALNLAGGFFLASIMPSLSVTLFKMAALCAVLIGLDVAADFLLPYVVEYIGWAALAIPIAIAGAVVYEVRAHPALLDFLYNWHLLSKAGPPDSGAIMSATIADEVQHAERTAAEVESSTAAALKRAEALGQRAGQAMIDSGTFPQQHANGLIAADSALSPKTPQPRKD